MEDPFILTVDYMGASSNFTAWLLLQGFTHKIKVRIDDREVFFEPDDQGGYRAVRMAWQEQKDMEKIDKHLLSLIAQKIQDVTSG
jgi:hypothetical protein